MWYGSSGCSAFVAHHRGHGPVSGAVAESSSVVLIWDDSPMILLASLQALDLGPPQVFSAPAAACFS
jgi:hypothetical protein